MYLLVAGGFRARFEQSYHPYHLLIADAFLHGQTHVRPELIERRAAAMTPLVRERLARIEASSGQLLSGDDRERLISQGVCLSDAAEVRTA